MGAIASGGTRVLNGPVIEHLGVSDDDVEAVARAEADEEVGLRIPGRQHQDRHRPVTLDTAAHLEAVETGEHEVEDDEVGPGPLDDGHARRAVGGHLHVEPLAPQPGGDGSGDGFLILDDDDSGHTRRIRIEPWRALRDDAEISRR